RCRGAVVFDVRHAIAVQIRFRLGFGIRRGIADIAHAIVIVVFLVRVRNQRTVVFRVRHVVAIDVVITGIAGAVVVEIFLVRVGNRRAVVGGIVHAVAIAVGVAIAGSAALVAAGVDLAEVGEANEVALRMAYVLGVAGLLL